MTISGMKLYLSKCKSGRLEWRERKDRAIKYPKIKDADIVLNSLKLEKQFKKRIKIIPKK